MRAAHKPEADNFKMKLTIDLKIGAEASKGQSDASNKSQKLL